MSGGSFRISRFDIEEIARVMPEVIEAAERGDMPQEVIDDLEELQSLCEEHAETVRIIDYLAAGDYSRETAIEEYKDA